MDRVVIIIIGLLTMTSGVSLQPDGMREYCNHETFTASCPQDQVIMMASARFGRMRLGECVETDFGYLGCSVDVMKLMDSKCSGRQTCSVPVADNMFENVNQCNREFKGYLEADYRCIPVVPGEGRQCRIPRPLEVSQVSGYIANVITEDTGCGDEDVPWRIEAQPGQKINFTLYDFTETAPRGSTACVLYGDLRESPQSSQSICGQMARVSHLYTSTGSFTEVTLHRQNAHSNTGYFLIHFKVIGCSNPDFGDHVWTQREDDVITARCNHGDRVTWTMTCVGNQWEGTEENCPLSATQLPNQRRTGSMKILSLPLEWAIIIIAGVAVAISSFIFLVGFVVLKRRHYNQKNWHRSQRTMEGTHTARSPQTDTAKHDLDACDKCYSGSQEAFSSSNENEYAYVWDNAGQGHSQGHVEGQGLITSSRRCQSGVPMRCATLDMRGKTLVHVESEPVMGNEPVVTGIRQQSTGECSGKSRHLSEVSEHAMPSSTPLKTFPRKAYRP